ncbi:hypothetical protein K8T06_04800 [bacterium]|nr:hypothetical protein [bacterium]
MKSIWIIEIAFFAAFLITFWPTRKCLSLAAVLWTVGIFSMTGPWVYYIFFTNRYEQNQFYSRSPLLLVWILPLSLLLVSIVQSGLLFPFIQKERALRVGKIFFLLVIPFIYFLYSRFYNFDYMALTIWFGASVLWFRIREKFD